MLEKIISGGQTGADLGGLVAAKLHGLNTGGEMPLGMKNHNGLNERYKDMFNMTESSYPTYPPRTEQNVYNSDATIRIAKDFGTAGEKCTLKYIKMYKKPYLDIHITDSGISANRVYETAVWLKDGISVLNVAGNSNNTWPGMQRYTTLFLGYVFMCMGFDRIQLDSRYNEFVTRGF